MASSDRFNPDSAKVATTMILTCNCGHSFVKLIRNCILFPHSQGSWWEFDCSNTNDSKIENSIFQYLMPLNVALLLQIVQPKSNCIFKDTGSKVTKPATKVTYAQLCCYDSTSTNVSTRITTYNRSCPQQEHSGERQTGLAQSLGNPVIRSSLHQRVQTPVGNSWNLISSTTRRKSLYHSMAWKEQLQENPLYLQIGFLSWNFWK